MRELARWLGRRGVQAYVLPAGALPRPARYVPHIYTGQELAALFAQTDRCHYDSQVPFRHLVMPVLFRTIYACGLRASEARLLRFGDVDLAAGVLTIRDGKGGKDRQVPVSAPLRDRLTDYHARVAGRTGGDWFFPGTSGRPLTLANIDKNFRRFLWQARIPHGGRGHGPRVHDLRHTMAVNNLRLWFASGQDAAVLLPVLQAYMGHSTIADTDYYLRLTAESYPHITARVQRIFGDVVPPVKQRRAMATDFAVMLHRFLTSHLAGLRGCSPATIASYRDTFKLLIVFFRDGRSIPPDKLTLDRIDTAAIAGFLNWLEAERHNSISTRNQRLAAISSFYRWLQTQDPARMASCQDILTIPAKKKAQPGVNHLTAEQTRRLLAQPDRSTRRGRRDATLLATLYDTAARVSELTDLTVRGIRLQPPPLAVLTGKGRKTRHVPLGGNTAALLNAYLGEHGLDKPGRDDHPLFVNQHGSKLSRGGIAWIIRKYQAKTGDPALVSADLSPHVLRHSKAMHLYEAGVPLPYIRDILGHVDLSTTEIYARASTEAKRKALEAAYTDIVTDDLPEWNQDPGLLNWLASL